MALNRRERRAERQRPGRTPHGAAELLAAALAHHQAGRLAEAAPLYDRLLAADPGHAEALHLRGVLAHQQGDNATACRLIRQALAVASDVALYHMSLGNALLAMGAHDEAVAGYRTALALRPDHAEAHVNLGLALQQRGERDAAAQSYAQALAHRPDFPEAHNHLGTLLCEQGQHEAAAGAFRKALQLRANFPEAHNNLGTVLQDLGDAAAAFESFRRAVALQPAFAAAHVNMAGALRRLGRSEAAIAACRRAIAIDAALAAAHDRLGILLADQGETDQALSSFRTAVRLRPDDPALHDNLGTVLMERGRPAEAAECFANAIARQPDFANAHMNLAMALLAQGRMAEGWAEYEWRWQTPAFSRPALTQPQWRGAPAAGQAILIHAEQGFGDTIQFCRYASLVAERGLRVTLQVPDPLVRLLRTLPAVDAVVADTADVPDCDLHCPMLSLPLAFGTTLAAIPAGTPYLHADGARSAALRARLDPADARPRIGLAWAGSAATGSDRRRSLPPASLAPLLAIPGLRFVSLQKDGPPAPFALDDLMAEMVDFADTAALIATLDLVIAVDTAVAHLAGALGKPVWLLSRFDAEWRWLTDRRDSPWYPGLRLYRQKAPGDWGSVIDAVAGDLRREWP